MSDDNKHHLAITAADNRRAAAIVAHHGRGDMVGISAILCEVNDEHRPTELILAVLDLYQELVPAIHTPLGIQFLSSYLHKVAGLEETP